MAQQVKAHVQQTTEVGSIFGSYGEREEPAPKSCPLISIPGCPHSLITPPYTHINFTLPKLKEFIIQF